MTRTRTWATALLWLGMVAPAIGGAQGPQPSPTFLGESLAGRDSFEAYCATCHGGGGRGDGPVASALKSVPADLTALSSRNGDLFPRDRVSAVLAGMGRTVSAHGTTEMPIWGPLFRMFESDARARVRIDNLVTYVESLQTRSRQANDTGRDLFRTYCASCHGADARGAGPVADHLRRLPPNLTSFAMRNGGVFPSERLRAIIDGRGVASHGDREMPVWGDAFKRTRGGPSDDVVRARIDAVVKYLEGIQERATY